jgi:hypothetical protein
MLQRFRTLFNLPSAIRGNIRKGEYDLAVREYQKAKSIVLPSHVWQLPVLFYLPMLSNWMVKHACMNERMVWRNPTADKILCMHCPAHALNEIRSVACSRFVLNSILHTTA